MKQLEMQPPPEPARVEIPPLENGDRLSREEFERRYLAMPKLKKAELIRGVVHMPSPVRHRQHSGPHYRFMGWLNFYSLATPNLEGGDNGTLRLGDEDEPQPDAYLMISSRHGGRARLDEDGYIVGAPEWVGEVAASSVSIDAHDKLLMYADHGVQEYVLWRVLDSAVDWFLLQGDRFVQMAPDADGIYRSKVMPGLWLDPRALIGGDMQRVFQIVQQGLSSAEHTAFLATLHKDVKGI